MRTIDDIIPPSRRQTEPLTNNLPPTRSNYRAPSQGGSRFPKKTFFVLLLILAVSVGALYYFSTAKIEITPNTISAAIQNSFTASQSGGDLPYQIVTAQKVASQTVAQTGSKTVSSSASGTITIYNTQSVAQKLIANTRFATTAGLIFRIHTAVTVPAGTNDKPGSVSAKVFADAAGASYNIPATSFTVPGLAGTPQASQVYARSTSPMAGGASGTVPVIDPAAESKAKQALIDALTPELTSALQGQVPDGYILVPGSATTTFQELTPAASATSGMADLKEQGTVTAVVFPNAALAKAVAASISGLGYQGESITLLPTSQLQLSATSLPTGGGESFGFTLTGTASLAYSIDSTRIAAAIAGKSRSEAEIALTNYPEIKRAIIILRPFWRQSFPSDPAKIAITVDNPQ